MLRTTWATWTSGRRGAVTAASAAVVVLGGVVAACGGGAGGGGYVAVGPAGASPQARLTPTGKVTLTPRDGTAGTGAGPSTASGTSEADPPEPADPGDGPGSPGPAGPPAHPGRTPGPPAATASAPTASAPTRPAPTTPAPTRTTPASPAALTWEAPAREATDKRWCEKVTVAFDNSGGTAVRSGTVTFGTHIIGALGIDWATIESTEELPVPIGAGAGREKTWTVCVDAWRVPLGMHIETRDVAVQWK
ncbi:hypothetical protein [Streptomyces sp. NPDC058964]|uniref:hypothetical protein n=1 Tax=Streptomyces sp. NPDC058964 TaxID=3346681 RepID=UPI00367C5B13